MLGEQQAGRISGGSVDLVWINGENFRSMREAGLLFGPYADRLPNPEYVNTTDASVANDFWFPVEGFESPYGSAQMVMICDAARVATPPAGVSEFPAWIRANPGRFSYPAPPDFTGSAFIRHVFYFVAGGYEDLLGPFNQAVYDDVAEKTWVLLNELEPYLWRSGRTYPESLTQQQQLFANLEIDFDMSYNPGSAANLVSQGRYPESTRTFVFDDGTICNTHYVAVPFNAANKAAALEGLGLLDPIAGHKLTFRHFGLVLMTPGFAESFGLTVLVSLISTILTVVLAVATASALRRARRFQRLITYLYQLPLTLPHMVIAAAGIMLLAQSGLMARLVTALGIIGQPAEFPALIYDRWGVGIILVYVWKQVPFVGLFALTMLQTVGKDYEAAARTLGARPGQASRFVLLPLVAPALIPASIIIFAFVFGAFEVPLLIALFTFGMVAIYRLLTRDREPQ